MVLEGRRIGAITTAGIYKRNARDLTKSKQIRTGNGAPPPPPRRKYQNVKVNVEGHTFDSKKEANVYVQLRALEKAGAVRNIEVQPKFHFPLRGQPVRHLPRKWKGKLIKGSPLSYSADFRYEELDGTKWKTVVLDVKGFDTQVSRIKRALVLAFHGVIVEVV